MALVPIPTPEEIRDMSKDALLMLQQKYTGELARLKLVESLLRAEVVNRYFGSDIKEGMNNYDLGRGYTLKVTHGFNYNLSESEKPKNGGVVKATSLALARIKTLGNEGAFIAERLVKWTPELSITEYRKLGDEYKKIIDTALTISAASPKVEVAEPK